MRTSFALAIVAALPWVLVAVVSLFEPTRQQQFLLLNLIFYGGALAFLTALPTLITSVAELKRLPLHWQTYVGLLISVSIIAWTINIFKGVAH